MRAWRPSRCGCRRAWAPADQFQNKAQILVENAGHNVFEAHPQVQDLLLRFFRGERVHETKLTLPPPKFRIS